MGDGAARVVGYAMSVITIAVIAAELSTGIASLVVAGVNTDAVDACGSVWYPLLCVGIGHMAVALGTVIKWLDLHFDPTQDRSMLHVDNIASFGLSIWACVAYFGASECDDAPDVRRALLASVVLLFVYAASALSFVVACCCCLYY